MAEHLKTGRLGERIACRYLLRRKYDILARRFRGLRGELDIVMLDGDTLVFVEVKTRSTRQYGDPYEFVDWEKQQKLRMTAEEFISRHDMGHLGYRFDIVEVVAAGKKTEEIAHYREVF
jgi:putative endonuclease